MRAAPDAPAEKAAGAAPGSTIPRAARLHRCPAPVGDNPAGVVVPARPRLPPVRRGPGIGTGRVAGCHRTNKEYIANDPWWAAWA